jgi:hypothetical protein
MAQKPNDAVVSHDEDAYIYETDTLRVVLPEEVIERAVFKKAELALSVTLDANVVLDPYGLSDELIDSLVEDVALPMRRLADLIAEAVDPDILAGEDDPRRALAKLREELEAALQSVRQAESRLP